jgi:predicted HTH transcriptional regulator
MCKPKRRWLIKDILYNHKIDLVSLQETKKEVFKDRTLWNLSNIITKWVVLLSNGRSGGILLGINEEKTRNHSIMGINIHCNHSS